MPKQLHKPVVLIALPTTGSIRTVNLAFAEGLSDRYVMRTCALTRRFGMTRTGKGNLLNLWYLLIHTTKWIACLARHRPSIAHYPTTSGWNLEKSLVFLSLARRLGCRTVLHLHGGSFHQFWEDMGDSRKRRIIRWIQRVDRFVVLSAGWNTWAAEHLRLPTQQIAVVLNPIDDQFERTALEMEPTENADCFFVGALGERKGVYDLLAVAKAMKALGDPTRFILAGAEERPGDLKKIRQTIARDDLSNIQLAGLIRGEAKEGLFKDHGIFLFPSYRENFPLVVLEAAAAGKAIITTRVGGLPEYFRDGESVLFVEPGDVQQIIDAVRTLIGDFSRRRRLGETARAVFVGHLNRANSMKSLDGLYRSLLGLSGEATGEPQFEVSRS